MMIAKIAVNGMAVIPEDKMAGRGAAAQVEWAVVWGVGIAKVY